MSMSAPFAPKAVWMVWTRSDMPDVFALGPTAGTWCWCAHGPRGSQSGIEATSDAARAKAQSAAVVLDDASRWGKGAVA